MFVTHWCCPLGCSGARKTTGSELPVMHQPARRTRFPANNGGSTELGKGGGPIPWADASADRRGSPATINRKVWRCDLRQSIARRADCRWADCRWGIISDSTTRARDNPAPGRAAGGALVGEHPGIRANDISTNSRAPIALFAGNANDVDRGVVAGWLRASAGAG